MALEPDDWKIDRKTDYPNINVRYIGDDHDGTSPSYATVIEFHRWLQSLADDAVATGDDELDITSTLPTQRSTDNIITLINGYNIDDAASEHLYDGSVIQNGSDDIYDGIVNFGNADVQIQIIQNGIVVVDDWWNYDGAGLNADATSGISHRFMIKTRNGGTDIDGRKIIGTCRRFGYTYSEFTINSTARGNNVLALTDSADLNNQTEGATVATWSSDFINTEGYALIDVDNNTVDEPYFSSWDLDTGTHTNINDFYEYTKYITRDSSSATVYGLSGELFRGITHQITITQTGGTFIEPEAVSWSGGTGQLLAIDSTIAGTKMWIQLLTGSAPTSGTITGSGGTPGTATASAAAEKTISKPFVGASTGSALIGSYGLGVVATDLSTNDDLTDLNTVHHSPPNFVTNTLTGLVSGEDRVLVAPWDGSSVDQNNDKAINKNQLTLTSTLNTADVASIQVSDGDDTAIPTDTPATGIIRVTDDDGYERWIPYSSWTGTTFTVDTAKLISEGLPNMNDFDGAQGSGTYQATAGNNVYIAYIDELASSTTAQFVSIQTGSRNLVIFVRDGGATPIKQYTSQWSQVTTNTTTPIIRTSDT